MNFYTTWLKLPLKTSVLLLLLLLFFKSHQIDLFTDMAAILNL